MSENLCRALPDADELGGFDKIEQYRGAVACFRRIERLEEELRLIPEELKSLIDNCNKDISDIDSKLAQLVELRDDNNGSSDSFTLNMVGRLMKEKWSVEEEVRTANIAAKSDSIAQFRQKARS